MSWLELARTIIALGPKAKAAWPMIMAIIVQLQLLVALFAPEAAAAGGLELTDPTPEEVEAEAQLSALLAEDGTQAVIDLTTIRTVIALARQIPQVATLLAGLLELLKGLGKK